jgi:hypothetical protein
MGQISPARLPDRSDRLNLERRARRQDLDDLTRWFEATRAVGQRGAPLIITLR